MKRFVISLSLILVFIMGAIFFEHWYMQDFAFTMNGQITLLEEAVRKQENVSTAMEQLNDAYHRNRPIVSQLVFSNRLEEVETVLYKLNAYIKAADQSEINATIAELRARMRLLSSSQRYYRNQKAKWGID